MKAYHYHKQQDAAGRYQTIPAIELGNLKKTINGHKILDDITLSIKKETITGIIGRSGAGKTTILRCINLLEKPDSGTIKINDNDVLTMNIDNLRKIRQKIGVVFQFFNLLTNKTVFDNIALPLRLLHYKEKYIKERVNYIASLVNIDHKLFQYPNDLSGGQKQRVAIARALTCDIDILLCDEFTSALDPSTILEILELLKNINNNLKITIVLITHNMDIIREICDQVYVVEQGQIIESGPVEEIFYNPQHEITRSLIKTMFLNEVPNTLIAKLSPIPQENGHVMVRLLFAYENSQKAIIAELVKKFAIPINIIAGHLDHIRNSTLGDLVITFPYELNLYTKLVNFCAMYKIHTELLGYMEN